MKLQEHILCALGEEGAELAHQVSKALRFGLQDRYPTDHPSNEERIRAEYADIVAVYELCGFEQPTRDQIEAKKDKVGRYVDYAMEIGTLDEIQPKG